MNTSKITNSFSQVKAGDDSEYLLDKMRQIVYSLHQSKDITKKVSNCIIKSIEK